MTNLLRASLMASSFALLAGACGAREKDCGDSIDDDGDGWKDCFDQDCAETCGEVCGNLIDDNGDRNIDCADPLCAGSCQDPGPYGPEDCVNGADDDGDWLTDCQDDDCDAVCDADGDGFIGPDYAGPDCDDGDAAVHPAAAEVPYNDVDDDCDPLTVDNDMDGDGFELAEDCEGTADGDPLTYPGAAETCGDQVLNDCAAPSVPTRSYCFGDRTASSADGVVFGAVGNGLAGYSVAMAGDTNLDGHADLVIGAYGDGDDNTGAAYLVLGPVAGDFDASDAAHKWLGESADSWAGFAVAGGSDLTGDGVPDLAIGARYDDQGGNNAGAVVVVEATAGGMVTALADESRKIVGSLQYDYAGSAVAMAGDVNGDGAEDLFIGSPNNSARLIGAGVAHLVYGPVLGPVQLSLVDYEIRGEAIDDGAGCAVAGPGDLDGDGLDDLVLGVCLNNRGGADSGGAFQFSTHLDTVPRDVDEADGALIAEASLDGLGSAVAGGDLNGDGLADILVGAPGNDGGGEDAGAVYVCAGPATASMNSPVAKLVGETAGDKAGTSIAVIGDIDGDGAPDVAVGAPGSDLADTDAGATYVLFGPYSGLTELDGADVRITGAAAYDFIGQSVAGGSDVDQDGFPDLLVGAPYNDSLNAAAGAVYLFTFGW
jgi:FG-GAP repeat/Putative metal-binding motif